MTELAADTAKIDPRCPGDALAFGHAGFRHGVTDIEKTAAMPRGQRADQADKRTPDCRGYRWRHQPDNPDQDKDKSGFNSPDDPVPEVCGDTLFHVNPAPWRGVGEGAGSRCLKNQRAGSYPA